MDRFLIQFAQRITPGSGDPGSGTVDIPTLDGSAIFNNVLNLVYFAAGVVAVIVIIIAGMSFASSGGDPGKVKSARNKIIFALVGLVLVLAAFAITNFVIGRF